MYSEVRNKGCVWMMVTVVCITAAAVSPRHRQRYGKVDKSTLSLRKDTLASCSDALLQELHTITDQLVDINKHRIALPHPPPVIHDCSTLHHAGIKGSGVYQVFPFTFQVYCDMVKHGGGWTVIQRRFPQESQEDFFRDWRSYRDGFGELRGEMWLGLEAMHQLTHSGNYELMVEMTDYELGPKYAHYEVFQVGPEEEGYRLHVANYSAGDAGDALTVFHDGRQFSTKDRDQDTAYHKSCAVDKEGGWWFQECYAAHPNGRFPTTLSRRNSTNIRWWKSNEEVLVLTHFEMKIRQRPTSESQHEVVKEEEEEEEEEEKDEERRDQQEDEQNPPKHDDDDYDDEIDDYYENTSNVYPTSTISTSNNDAATEDHYHTVPWEVEIP